MSATSAVEGPRWFAPRSLAGGTAYAASWAEGPKGSKVWHEVGSTIEEEGAQQPVLRIVLSGWAGCCRILSDGRRQIVHLLIPGDTCGLPGLVVGPTLCSTVALTRVRTASFGSLEQVLRSPAAQDVALANVVRREAAKQHEALLDHVVRLGRMSALERTAHLLLDLHARLQAVGLTQGETAPLPLTQEILADALGLSVVHMNRTLQELRRQGLIECRAGRLKIGNRSALVEACAYDRALTATSGATSGGGGRRRPQDSRQAGAQ
jgi:CRP-like cAMP-binding protein